MKPMLNTWKPALAGLGGLGVCGGSYLLINRHKPQPLAAAGAPVIPDKVSSKPQRRYLYLDTTSTWSSWQTELYKGGEMPGTVAATLTERRAHGAEDGYYDMVSSFAASKVCPNVSNVNLEAPQQALDARFLLTLGEHRPNLKSLDIQSWTYRPSEEDDERKWSGFKQLNSVTIDLASGKDFPNCFNDIVKGMPKSVKRLDIKNAGPDYPLLDCSLVRGLDEIWLRGLTLKHHEGIPNYGLYTRDCKLA